VTSEAVLAEIATPFGIDADGFAVLFAAEEVQAATRADFELVQGLGIGGFPTVVLQTGNRLEALTVGYRAYADLEPELTRWLAGPGLPE
jgi:putative protein-disulfide isomerase